MKNLSNLFTTLVIAMPLLVGCSAGLDEEKSVSAGTASTFYASDVETVSSNLTTTNSSWNIYNVNKFELKTCLKDMAYGKKVMGQKFEVRGDTITAEATSNDDGCITWEDSISFDYLTPERDIEIEREIVGLGDFSGSFTVKFATNPWKGTVKDLRTAKVVHTSSSLATTKLDNTLKITDSVLLSIHSQKILNNKINLEATIKLTPKMLGQSLENGRDAKDAKAITRGNFLVSVQVFENNNNKLSALSERINFEAAVNGNGEIIQDINLLLLSIPARENKFEVALTLTPDRETAPESLTDLEGTIVLSNLNEGEKKGTFYEKDLNATKYFQALEKSEIRKDIKPIYIHDINVTRKASKNVKQGTEDVKTNVTACIMDRLQNKNIAFTDVYFEIVNENNEVIHEFSGETNRSGCISTKYEVFVNLNEKRDSDFIKHTVKITTNDRKYDNLVAERRYYINPWSNDFAHTSLNEEPKSYTPTAAKMFTKGFRVDFQSNDGSKYRVNQMLDLSIVKNIKLSLTPQVLRVNEKENMKELDNHVPKNLKVRAIIVAPRKGKEVNADSFNTTMIRERKGTLINTNNYRFITGTEKEVKLTDDGKLITHLDFKINSENFNVINSRTYFILEISSAEDDSIVPMIGTGPVTLAIMKDSIELSNETRVYADQVKNANELYQMFGKIKDIDLDAPPKSKWLVNSYNLLDKLADNPDKIKTYKGLDQVKHTVYESIGAYRAYKRAVQKNLLTQEEFDSIMKFNNGAMTKKLNEKICNYFFNRNGKIKSTTTFAHYGYSKEKAPLLGCLHTNGKRLNLKGIKHIMKIVKQPVDAGSNQGSINISTAKNADRSVRHSEYWGWRVGFGLKLDMFKLPLIGEAVSLAGGFSGSVDKGESWSKNDGTGERVSIGESQRLDSETLFLKFQAETRRCVIIQTSIGKQEGLRICEGEDKVEEIRESWHFVTDPWRRRNFIADGASKNERKMTQIIRGAKYYETFKEIINQGMIEIFNKPEIASVHMQDYLELLQTPETDSPILEFGSFPGTYEGSSDKLVKTGNTYSEEE